MSWLSKPVIFGVLVGLGIIFGILAIRRELTFGDEIWSNLFWLVASTILTTVVLETVLQYDQDRRSREGDAFAFRVFSANMLRVLLAIADRELELCDEVMEAALTGQSQFAETAARAAKCVSTGGLNRQKYNQHYLDISQGLRDFSRNYIRLFSSNQKEMVQNYRSLNDLASVWEYKGSLTQDFEAYTASLPQNSDDRITRESETLRHSREAQNVLRETSDRLAELSHKVAGSHRGVVPLTEKYQRDTRVLVEGRELPTKGAADAISTQNDERASDRSRNRLSG